MNTEYYEQSEKIRTIAEKVISEHEDLAWIPYSASVDYVVSGKQKKKAGRAVLGECMKVKDIYKLYIPYDFIIVIYTQNTFGLTDEQMEILLYHELLHIGVNEKDGETEYTVTPHDIEDFKTIIRQY